ncbi:hypothetical protein [Salinibacterium sp. M195]|uniref:hypothetical protein n=1 Tax=Salinibacterium sp. M195 TaxID=2583374 RepID=UPI001C6369E7|nr:hypothetical protein [Salinibacterium sp. M195]QYH34992.1 hypothetical protein FFT87_02955 [Salinibacterium sp. M195]
MNSFGRREVHSARLVGRGIIAAAAATLVIVSLAGCSPAGGGGDVPDAPKPSSAEPSAEPVAEPLVIPSCEQMLPVAVYQEFLGERGELLVNDERGPDTDPWLLHAEGFEPILDTVVQREQCLWGLPANFHAFFTGMVADTSETDLDELRTQIATAGYETTPNGDIETFTHQEESEDGYFSPTIFLVDDLWIYIDLRTPEQSLTVGNEMLSQVRALNPTRGY